MIIGDSLDSLQLEAEEHTPTHFSGAADLRVSVTLKANGFTGSYDEVWIELPELLRFVNELEVIVEDRRGSAKLAAIDPREFAVEIREFGSAGHFEVEAHLGRFVLGSSSEGFSRVVGVFDIDPGSLPAILKSFKELLA